jgi:hypothetical protein
LLHRTVAKQTLPVQPLVEGQAGVVFAASLKLLIPFVVVDSREIAVQFT